MSALLDHSEDIYRGAFYIIDNAGQCPSGVNESDFQHSTIEAHLRRHTYYQLTDKGNIRVDVETMHAFIRGLYSYEQLSDAVTKSAHGCQSSEDLADSFFHLGTDKLSPQTLVSYGYEKSTFREEDLPKYAPPSLPKRSGVNAQHQHIRRSFWVIIQDIEATKAQRDHAAYKYRDRVSRFNALAALIRDFSLKYSSRKGTLKSCTSEQLCKTFLDTWKSQKNGGATNASSPWASSSKDWKPSYLESIEQSCAKLTLGESLRSYNPDQAVSLSTDLVREAKDSMIADPKRAVGEAAADGIELDVDVIEVYDDKLSSRAGRVDDIADGLQRVRSLTSAPTATVKPVSTSPLGRSTRATLEAARRMRSDAQRAATCSDSLDEVSEALSSLSGSDSETSRATLIDHKRKRVISDTYSRGKRQNAMNDPPSMTATRTPPIDGQDRTDVASWVAHRLGSDVAGDKPVNAYNSCGAQPPLLHRPREMTCHRQISERPVLTALNLSKLESELKDIYRKMSNASLQLLDGVGDVGEETMPLDTDPPSSTSELHIRCWGDEWPRIRAKLKHSKLFSVPDVAMSLNSAYLFDKILRRPVQKIQVTLDPEADFASGSIGDDSTMKRLCALIAQDPSFQQGLNKDAARLADGLWNAIRSHIKRLQIHAEDFGILRDGDLDSIWVRTINPAIMDVFQDALRLRISLMGTECGYSFTWPHSGQEFDPRTMQTNAGGSLDLTTKRTVAFTLFPGLKVTALDLNDGQPEPVYKAVVKLYTPSAVRLSSTA